MIKGIIFDLDGTLIDSMYIWYQIDKELAAENGIADLPREVSERIKKMSINEAAQFCIDELGFTMTKERIISRIEELVRIEYEEKIQLKPYVAELLDFLDEKGIPYCAATATYKGLAEAVMKRCEIYDRMKFLLTDVEYPKGKKFPDIFLGAAERLGTSPADTLVVEDSLHCLKTAFSAGFMTAAVYDEAAEPERDEIERIAGYYADSLNDIKNYIAGNLL